MFIHHRVRRDEAAVDCDGVALNFDTGFAAVAADTLGRPMVRRSNAYEMGPRYGLTRPELDRVWAAMDDHPQGWAGLAPLPGAREALEALRAAGLKLHMVTGIDPRLEQRRWDNLEAHGIRVDSMTCVGMGHASKRSALEALAPVMFVDDRLHLVEESPFIPDRVWVDHGDEQTGHVVHEEIIRVESLAQWVRQWSLREGIRARPVLTGGLRP